MRMDNTRILPSHVLSVKLPFLRQFLHMLQFGNVSSRRESLVIFVGVGGPILRVRAPFIVLQANQAAMAPSCVAFSAFVRQRLAGIFAELVRFGGRIRGAMFSGLSAGMGMFR